MTRSVLGLLVVALAAVVLATAASSQPAAGITVNAQEPVTAIIGSGTGGVYRYGIVVAATFAPDVLHDSVRVTSVSTNGGIGVGPWSGDDSGNVLHTTAVYQNSGAVFEGERLLISVKWTAWTPLVSGRIEGSKTASAIMQVPKREPAPRLDSVKKERLASKSTTYYAACAAFGISSALAAELPPVAIAVAALAAESCAAGAVYHGMALDPVDLNFKVVAKPKTPPAIKVSAGKGVSTASASAVNKLLALQAQEIGLGRAIVTAFNRSQGAHVKKQTEWEKKQVRAAGTYADQLSSLMLTEAKLRPVVRRALSTPLVVTEAQAYAFQDSLLARGSLPAPLGSALAKLGMTKAELKEVRAQLIVRNLPTLYDGDALGRVADPNDLKLLRQVAADLKSFARQAARDPLRIP